MARLTVPTVVINSAPGTTDDRSKGYDVGTFWFNYSSGNLYVLKDNSVGAAVWSAISGGGGGGSVTSVTGTAPIASSGGTTPAISLSDGGVTLAKLANLATKSLIGRKTAGTGVPEAISTSDLAGMFGTPDGTKFLADDGTLKVPSGGGGGGVITDWSSSTATIGAVTTPPTKGVVVNDTIDWRRVGDSQEVRIDYRQSSGGSSGSGVYLFLVPDGKTIDSSKISFNPSPSSIIAGVCGFAVTTDSATFTHAGGIVMAYDATHVAVLLPNVGALGSGADGLSGNRSYQIIFTVPIVEWA